jgi:microcin C transport system permease protein
MFKYILKRLLLIMPTLLGIISITFLVIQFVPGGPVEQFIAQTKLSSNEGGGAANNHNQLSLNKGMDSEQIQQIKALYGFDKPVWQRYIDTIVQFLRFDLGASYFHHQPVLSLILSKLPVSISLGLWTFLLSYLICIPLGIYKAQKNGSMLDKATTITLLILHALPGFALGVVLLVLFAGGNFWQIFPLRGLVSSNWEALSWWSKILDYMWHMILPITAMLLAELVVLTQLTKNGFLEELNKNYVLVLKAKGLKPNYILYRHVLKNALLPIISSLPSAFIASLFAGSLLIENLFSLDGLGLLSYESIMRRDYPVVLGTLYIFTLLGLLTKLCSDIFLSILDPRIKF